MKRLLTATILGLVGSVAVADDEAHWNAGLAAAFANYEFENGQVEDNSTGFKLFGGYRFNQWFGLEGAYHNFGDFEEDINAALPFGNADVAIDGFAGSALVYLPVGGEELDVFAKAGYFAFDQEATVFPDENPTVTSNSPSGLLAGLGARLAISEQFGLRAEGEWYNVDDGDLWSLNLGLEYLFGRAAAAAVPVAAAAPPPAPEPAPAPPPPPPPADSDGDGVIDSADDCPGTPAGAKVDARGCEAELVLRGVNFEYNSAVLTPQDEAIVDSVAEILAKRPGFDVLVVGHTDSTGSDAYNLDLSDRRANAVRDRLIARGIPADQLRAEGRGETEPVADNGTPEGRAENRRVTLQFAARDVG
jgi:outer membrane protein OmpA-like peptidoglycan-associated protein